MNREVEFLVKNYLICKDVDSYVEILKKHLFLNCKPVDEKFKNSIALGFLEESQAFLFLPKFNIKDATAYNEAILYFKPLSERQQRLAELVRDEINKRFKEYDEGAVIETEYQSLFEEYCQHIVPSQNRRGNMDYKLVDYEKRFIADLKEDNPKVFKMLNELDTKIRVSVDLIMMVCKNCLKLVRINDEGEYQLNLKNSDIIRIMHEYCELTNTPYYKDEYNKVSNIRSIINRLAVKIYSKKYDISEDKYVIRKHHCRLLLTPKIFKKNFLFLKSIYNHFISFNELNNLLHKLSVHNIKLNRKNTKVFNKAKISTHSNNNTS